MKLEDRIYQVDEGRFWAKVRKTDSCWIWSSTLTGNGYGRFIQKGKYLTAHRVSYELSLGPIPDGFVVAHSCDQPACVNPDHLTACTQAENMADMAAKGRARNAGFVGEQCGNSKLRIDDVRRIRQLATIRGISYEDLGRQFRVTKHAIFRIVKRQTWAHVP